MSPVRSAVVLGAGTMGGQIAGHLANAGLQVHLLDLDAAISTRAIAALRTLTPAPLFVPEAAASIRPGSFDDLSPVAGADWVVEAIVEDLAAKQTLLARVEPLVAAHAVISSNTSGIPLAAIAAGRSDRFRRQWIGTHFFNPPRYLRLVEIIPTDETNPEIVLRLMDFVDRRLGKGVVVARDTPGFIANRIGMFGAVRTIEALASGAFTIEEIDALTGPLIGRPKSATFRTLDIAGLDIFGRVAEGLVARLPPDEAALFRLPPLVAAMIARGQIGAKTGEGFYRRVKHDGESAILVLDVAAGTYRDATPVTLPGLDAIRARTDLADRLRALMFDPGRIGTFMRGTLGATLVHAARVAPDVALSPGDVDRAMRWGFGWELGPFEMWDAIGVDALVQATCPSNPPPIAEELRRANAERFHAAPFDPSPPGTAILREARRAGAVVKSNQGASLVDLGHGVLCVELHSKMNAIGGDTIAMLQAGVREAADRFAALVVATEADLFSAGANLMLLLLEAQEGNWDEIDQMVRAFQGMTTAIRTSAVPVVIAPAGLALGGGCEICLRADRVQAAAETYIGLVEVGVGLIPAAGGTTEMLLRAVDRAAGGDSSRHVQAAFETMAFAKVSTSAADARRLGYLREVDGVTMNRDRLVADAKARALERVRDGYQSAPLRAAVPVGGADTLARLSLGVHLARRADRITDHDALIARKLARILAGGDVPHRTVVSEAYLLDLEREAFLSLCGEVKTHARIAHMLKTGKPLRN